MKAAALLFDMDGTLVESTTEVEQIWGRWCRLRGVPLEQVLAICHGLRSQEVLARVAPHLDVQAECRVLEDMELASTAAVRSLPGAREFVQALGGLPWAVVTSASRRVALQRLRLCGFPDLPLLIGSDDVRQGKPDPEPYRSAARCLGVSPADCLVFEDAPAGIQSALEAGCRVLQVGGARRHERVHAHFQHWGQVRRVSAGRPIEIELQACQGLPLPDAAC